MLANGGRNKQACTDAVVCLQNLPLQYFPFKMLSKQPFFSQFFQVFLSIIVNFILLNLTGRLFFPLHSDETPPSYSHEWVAVCALVLVLGCCLLWQTWNVYWPKHNSCHQWCQNDDDLETMKLGRVVLIVYYGCQRAEEDMHRGLQHNTAFLNGQ